MPHAPRGWDEPVVAANVAVGDPGKPHQNTVLSVDDETYISWAITNTGPFALNHPFYVDLYFDGVVVERWHETRGMSINNFAVVMDWESLQERVRLQPGTHTLKLVVDSTNLIPETDESDNTFEREFTWAGDSATLPTPARLPDLAPSTREGWEAPIVATSYAGDTADGPLSVAVPSYIGYSGENRGLSSTPRDVWLYLYLDDILVDRQSWSGLLVDDPAGRRDWAELFQVTNVPAGVHTLKLVVDPNDLIQESDEENNVFEKVFTWSDGPVLAKSVPAPPPEPTPPAPLILPNLVPGWRHGWDGPIIVSHQQDTFLDGPLTVEQTPFIDIVVRNQSGVAAGVPFSVDLYFDGEKVRTFEVSNSTPPGVLRWWQDWDGLHNQVPIAPGPHTLKMVIDPSDAVFEANEDDNVYEKTFVWAAGEVSEPQPIEFTDSELQQMLANLPALLDTRGPALSPDGTGYTKEVLAVAEAGYFLMTGKSLQDERVDIQLLTHDAYLAWIDEHFAERFAVSEPSKYPAILASRERAKNQALGFKTRWFGRVSVVVDAQLDVAQVINSLAHELGHMRQDFLNPSQTEADGFYYLDAIQEAGAQQFERAFWLALEEFTGLSLLAYPDFEGFQRHIDFRFNSWLEDLNQDEHWLGHLLQWLAVLDDPALSDLRQELGGTGRLGASSSLRLYDNLVGLAPESVQAYVLARLRSLTTFFETIVAESKTRLVPGLHPDSEGTAALRVPGLMAP